MYPSAGDGHPAGIGEKRVRASSRSRPKGAGILRNGVVGVFYV